MATFFGFYTERCRESVQLSATAADIDLWHTQQESFGIEVEGAVVSVSIENESIVTPSMFTDDGSLILEGTPARWLLEDGEWHHDGC